jgi:PIN domain nuclease of toxin-antitoxin system
MRLSVSAREIVENPEHQIFVNAVSIYEIELQFRLKRLPPFPESPTELVKRFGYESLMITPAQMERAGRFPLTHRDPWDRILAAQSLLEGLPVISRDEAIQDLGAVVIW